MSEDKLGYASLKPEGGIENDWESRHPIDMDPDEPMEFQVFKPNNIHIQTGEMTFQFYREKPYTWLQVKLLRFCLGFEVIKNDA